MGRSKEFEEVDVLNKAMELFWTKGYTAVSMNDLVEHMGIHRKSIYDTFGDKHSLYIKALESYKENSTKSLHYVIKNSETASQTMEAIFDYMIKGENCGCFLVNATTEMAALDDQVAYIVDSGYKEAEKLIADVIERGQYEGAFSRDIDVRTMSEVLHNALLGIRVGKRKDESEEKLIRLKNFYLNLLENK